MLASTLIAGLTLALGGLGVGAQAPEAECLRLLGSVACPGCKSYRFQHECDADSQLSPIRLHLPIQPVQRVPFLRVGHGREDV